MNANAMGLYDLLVDERLIQLAMGAGYNLETTVSVYMGLIQELFTYQSNKLRPH